MSHFWCDKTFKFICTSSYSRIVSVCTAVLKLIKSYLQLFYFSGVYTILTPLSGDFHLRCEHYNTIYELASFDLIILSILRQTVFNTDLSCNSIDSFSHNLTFSLMLSKALWMSTSGQKDFTFATLFQNLSWHSPYETFTFLEKQLKTVPNMRNTRPCYRSQLAERSNIKYGLPGWVI
jgi:hypothetical protein